MGRSTDPGIKKEREKGEEREVDRVEEEDERRTKVKSLPRTSVGEGVRTIFCLSSLTKLALVSYLRFQKEIISDGR